MNETTLTTASEVGHVYLLVVLVLKIDLEAFLEEVV